MTTTAIVERDAELETLGHLLDEALDTTTRFALIVGEAGIGKTRLAQEVADLARGAGARVSWGRAWDLGEAPTYLAWKTILDDLEIDIPLTDVAREGAERLDLFDAVARALQEKAAEAPLVLILDDMHALDDPSIVLMRYLTRYLRDARLLVVATYRDDEVDPASVKGQAIAAAARDATVIVPRRLTPEGAGQYFQQVAGFPAPAAVSGAVEAAARGNPLFVEQIARHVARGADIRRPDRSVGFRVPSGIEEVFRNKIERSGGPRLEGLLGSAAVLGVAFETRVLERLLDVDSTELVEDLTLARRAGVLEEMSAGATYAFVHTFLREFLYERQSPAKRLETHRKAAEVLEALDPERYVGEIADHLFKAGRMTEPGRALEWARKAGIRALETLAYEDAARHFHRALALARDAGADASTIDILSKGLAAAENPSSSAATQPRDPGQPSDTTEPNRFTREGEFWTVMFAGDTARFKDAKGFRWLATLLSSPGREFHVLDLAGGRSESHSGARDQEKAAGSDAGEMLDAQARSAYAARIRELEEDLEEAEANNDLERAGRMREELWFITAELRKATGLGGQPRKIAAESERARVSVTRAVRLAIEKIAQENKALGRHLEATISTGTFVSYTPDPRVPVEWHL